MEIPFISDESILNVYPYGSRVYQTNHEGSDYDYIVVTSSEEDFITQTEFDNQNFTIYSKSSFEKKIKEHEISVLECLCLPKQLIIQEKHHFDFSLDLSLLRSSVSSKSSNSWVKAKKKLTIEKDYNLYIAQKSLFHSMRILLFGKELAIHGMIQDFSIANQYWNLILGISEKNWETYKVILQPLFNQLKTEFKKVCPKEN